MQCGTLPETEKDQAVITYTGSSYNSAANITCLPGYEMKDGSGYWQVTCSEMGTWLNITAYPGCQG